MCGRLRKVRMREYWYDENKRENKTILIVLLLCIIIIKHNIRSIRYSTRVEVCCASDEYYNIVVI